MSACMNTQPDKARKMKIVAYFMKTSAADNLIRQLLQTPKQLN